jgi:hypothetical protein
VVIATGSPSGSVGVSASRTVKLPAPASTLVMLDASRLHISRDRTLRVRLRCEQTRCRGSLELVARAAGRAILAKGTFSIAHGQTETVTLHLTRAGVRRLAHLASGHIAARLTVVLSTGQAITEATAVY